jgi:type II secretory pathway predicted ATPase ExeA
MNYNMEGMNKEEGRNYIHEKLEGAVQITADIVMQAINDCELA